MGKSKRFSIILLMTFLMVLTFSYECTAYQNVQKKITITSIDNVGANIIAGESYSVPSTVLARYSNGSTKNVKVSWENKKLDTSAEGTYKINGVVAGYNKKVVFILVVNKKIDIIKDIPDISINVNQYTSVVYTPSVITAIMEDGTKKSVPIVWENYNIDTSKVGNNVIYGTVQNYNKKVKYTVIIDSYESDYKFQKLDNNDNYILLSNKTDSSASETNFTQNDLIYLSWEIINTGTGDSSIFPELNIMLDNNKIDMYNYQTISDVKSTLFKNIPLGKLKTGKHRLTISINPDHSIPELNYNDNSTDIEFTVSMDTELSNDYYIDTTGGYQFKLPNLWGAKMEDTKPDGCISLIDYKVENNDYDFMVLGVYNTNVQQLTDAIATNLSGIIIKNMLTTATKFQEDSRKKISLNGNDAYDLTFSGEIKDQNDITVPLTEHVYAIIHNNRLFLAYAFVSGEMQNEYIDLLSKSIQTLIVTN